MAGKETGQIYTPFFCLIFTLFLLGCTSPVYSETAVASVTHLSGCRGLNEADQPSGLSNIFSPYDLSLPVCGYLQTRQPLTVEIRWYYEEKLIGQWVDENRPAGYFSGVIPTTAGQTLPEGTYSVEALADGQVVQRLQMEVEQP